MNHFDIDNDANPKDVLKWILIKMAKKITKRLARSQKCKAKDLYYYVSVIGEWNFETKEWEGEHREKEEFFKNINLLEFFRICYEKYPDNMLCLCAYNKDIVDERFWVDSSWIADATTGDKKCKKETDVSGLIQYIWKNVQNISDIPKKL